MAPNDETASPAVIGYAQIDIGGAPQLAPADTPDRISEQLLNDLAAALFPEQYKAPHAAAHPGRRFAKDAGMVALHTVGLASAALILYAIYLRAGQGADLIIHHLELDEDQAKVLRVLVPASTALGNLQQYVNGNITQITLLFERLRRFRGRPAALNYTDYSVPGVFSRDYYSRRGLFRPAMPNIIAGTIITTGASTISVLPNLGIVFGSGAPTAFELFSAFNVGFVTSRLNQDALTQWYERIGEWLKAAFYVIRNTLGRNPNIQRVPSLRNLLRTPPKTTPQEVKAQLQEWVRVQKAIAIHLPRERRHIVAAQIRRIINNLPQHPAFTQNPGDLHRIIPVIFTYFTTVLPPLSEFVTSDAVAMQKIQSVLNSNPNLKRKAFIFFAVAVLLYSSIATVGNAWRALDNPALAWLGGAKEFIKWCSLVCIFALSSNFTYDQLTQLMLPNRLPYIVSQTYSRIFYSLLSFFFIGILFSYGVAVESISRFISRAVCEPEAGICPEVADYSPWILLTMIIAVLNNMLVSRFGLNRTVNIATSFLTNDSSVMNRYYIEMVRFEKWLSDMPSQQLYALLLFAARHCPAEDKAALATMFNAMGLSIAEDGNITVIPDKKFFDAAGLSTTATTTLVRFSGSRNDKTVGSAAGNTRFYVEEDVSPRSTKSDGDNPDDSLETDPLLEDPNRKLNQLLEESRMRAQSRRCAVM